MASYIDNLWIILSFHTSEHTMENKILHVERSGHRYMDDVIRCLKNAVNK
jgi:hypothetical protein